MGESLRLDRVQSYATKPQANPSAGADWTVAVPARTYWRLKAAYSELTTSATVANRVVGIRVKDAAGKVVFFVKASAAQAASLTQRYSAGTDLPSAVADVTTLLPLPQDLVMREGWTVESVTTLIQAGDQFANVTLAVEEITY